MVHFPISIIVRRHWFILWQSSPFYGCDPAVKGSPDEPNTVAVHSDVTQAVAVKVDEGRRPGAKLDGAELEGADVTSGGAVVVAVDVAGKASLVSAKQRP